MAFWLSLFPHLDTWYSPVLITLLSSGCQPPPPLPLLLQIWKIDSWSHSYWTSVPPPSYGHSLSEVPQIKPRHSHVFSFQFLFSFEYGTSLQTFMGVSIFPKPHPAARCWPISSEGCPLGNRILVMFTSSAPYTSVDVSDFPEVHWVQKIRSNSIQMFKSIDLKICASSSRLPTCYNFMQLLTHRSLLSRFGGPSLPLQSHDPLHE